MYHTTTNMDKSFYTLDFFVRSSRPRGGVGWGKNMSRGGGVGWGAGPFVLCVYLLVYVLHVRVCVCFFNAFVSPKNDMGDRCFLGKE